MKTVYLLLCVDTRSRIVSSGTRTGGFRDVAVGIYGEEHPTTASHVFTTCIMKVSHENYGEARDGLVRLLHRSSANHLRWVTELLRDKVDGVGLESISYADAEREMLRWASIAEEAKKRSD